MNIYHATIEMKDGTQEEVILNALTSKSAGFRAQAGLREDGRIPNRTISARKITEAKAGKLQDEGVRCWVSL